MGGSFFEGWSGEVRDGVDGEVYMVGGGGGGFVVFAALVRLLSGVGREEMAYATRFSFSYWPFEVNWRSRSV